MDFEFERSNDAEIAAASTHAPIEIRIFLLAGTAYLTVCGNDVDCHYIIECQAESPSHPAETSTGGQPANARM